MSDPRQIAREKYARSPKGQAKRREYQASALRKNRQRITALVRQYKLSEQQAQVASISMEGDICAACGRFARLVVDHDHSTGRARGMTCGGCNTAMGHSGDSPKILRLCAAYLENQ